MHFYRFISILALLAKLTYLLISFWVVLKYTVDAGPKVSKQMKKKEVSEG